jgi:hypothetical protein
MEFLYRIFIKYYLIGVYRGLFIRNIQTPAGGHPEYSECLL